MPSRRSATVVLATARLSMEAAERRKYSFVRLGMPPTFITDFQRAPRRRPGFVVEHVSVPAAAQLVELDPTLEKAS